MAFSLKPHVVKKKEGSEGAILARVSPYVRLMAEGGPPIFIQHGAFYTEGGQSMKRADLPDWFEEELKKMTPLARRECGLDK